MSDYHDLFKEKPKFRPDIQYYIKHILKLERDRLAALIIARNREQRIQALIKNATKQFGSTFTNNLAKHINREL